MLLSAVIACVRVCAKCLIWNFVQFGTPGLVLKFVWEIWLQTSLWEVWFGNFGLLALAWELRFKRFAGKL